MLTKCRKWLLALRVPWRDFISVVSVPKQRRVLVFGDSHSKILAGRGFWIRHLGPITLHRACRFGEAEKLVSIAFGGSSRSGGWLLRFLFRDPQAIVVCSFGEIDLRAHIHLQSVKQALPGDEIVRSLGSEAVEFLIRISELTQCNVIFLGVPPPSESNNLDFPVSGEIGDRVRWTRTFNSQVEQSLRTLHGRRISTLQLGNLFEDKDGSLSSELSDGGVHLGKVCSKYLREGVALVAFRNGLWVER